MFFSSSSFPIVKPKRRRRREKKKRKPHTYIHPKYRGYGASRRTTNSSGSSFVTKQLGKKE